jgi:hypothetical protein
MSVSGMTRVAVVALAVAVAGVPAARRLCGLSCAAVASPSSAAKVPRHCPAHPARPDPTAPESRSNPCGHAHGGDAAFVTASSSPAKAGARTWDAPAPLVFDAPQGEPLGPCGWSFGFDRRSTLPPPAARHPVLRL